MKNTNRKGFRRSREAMLIDFVLLPLGILRSVLLQGVPETLRELRDFPRGTATKWREAEWFFFRSPQKEA